jgi:SAM-dependent methyltransferase
MADRPAAAKLAAVDAAFSGLSDGYEVSRRVVQGLKKQKRFAETEALQYGEVAVPGFAHYLRTLDVADVAGKTFFDIGAGTGKAVLAAWAVGFGTSVGVEIVRELFLVSEQAREALQQAEQQHGNGKVEFLLGSCLDAELCDERWRAADVLFLPVTLFTDDMLVQIQAKISRLAKPGAVVLSTTRRLSDCPNLVAAAERGEARIKLERGSLAVHRYLVT